MVSNFFPVVMENKKINQILLISTHPPRRVVSYTDCKGRKTESMYSARTENMPQIVQPDNACFAIYCTSIYAHCSYLTNVDLLYYLY